MDGKTFKEKERCRDVKSRKFPNDDNKIFFCEGTRQYFFCCKSKKEIKRITNKIYSFKPKIEFLEIVLLQFGAVSNDICHVAKTKFHKHLDILVEILQWLDSICRRTNSARLKMLIYRELVEEEKNNNINNNAITITISITALWYM